MQRLRTIQKDDAKSLRTGRKYFCSKSHCCIKMFLLFFYLFLFLSNCAVYIDTVSIYSVVQSLVARCSVNIFRFFIFFLLDLDFFKHIFFSLFRTTNLISSHFNIITLQSHFIVLLRVETGASIGERNVLWFMIYALEKLPRVVNYTDV